MPIGGIRTRNPSKRAAADPRLKRLDLWDGQSTKYQHFIAKINLSLTRCNGTEGG